MAQKIRKIQIGNTTIEQIIEVPDAEPICELKPKRRGRKAKGMDDNQLIEPSVTDWLLFVWRFKGPCLERIGQTVCDCYRSFVKMVVSAANFFQMVTY